jgi:hypothetical protein
LALFGAGQVQAAPSANGLVNGVGNGALVGNVVQALPKFSYVNFINGCWAATTIYSVSSNTNNAYALSEWNSGVTGSTVGVCENINSDPLLTWIDMLLPNSTTVVAGPSVIGSNGSDFQVNYRQQ